MKKNIAKQFELIINSLPTKHFPIQSVLNPHNMYALLTTNELANEAFTVDKKSNAMDGYIIGVGFGNIFKMLELFVPDSCPKAIIALDVQPEVVLLGKIIVEKLKRSTDREDFLKSLHSINSEEIECVLEQTENTQVKKTLEQVSSYILKTFTNTPLLIEQGSYLTPSIKEIFSKQYAVLKKLALANNIAVLLMSINNIKLMESILELEHYSEVRSVIYLSNAIDHITNRGLTMKMISSLEKLKKIQTSRQNVFVDTTQSLKYMLRVQTAPPQYSQKDYPQKMM